MSERTEIGVGFVFDADRARWRYEPETLTEYAIRAAVNVPASVLRINAVQDSVLRTFLGGRRATIVDVLTGQPLPHEQCGLVWDPRYDGDALPWRRAGIRDRDALIEAAAFSAAMQYNSDDAATCGRLDLGHRFADREVREATLDELREWNGFATEHDQGQDHSHGDPAVG